MLLSNVHIIDQAGSKHIYIRNGKIDRITDAESGMPSGDRQRLSFPGAIAFPGLINSHDHLDFGLFPQLRSRIYESYLEWGADIHRSYGEKIGEVLRVPRELRARWGIYKNLLSGITTVMHHGQRLDVPEDLISIPQKARSFHSISGEKGWRLKLIDPLKTQPVVIHVGEGSSPEVHAEIDELIKWNLFRRRLIGIHGVAMTEKQAASFQALIWCPDSNFFLLDKTADIAHLKYRTTLLFGTDSTLTASWNIWEHLRLAREQKMVTDAELFGMLTASAASIWSLKDSGSLAEGQWADIVIARPPGGLTGWDGFYALDPENILLVMHRGNIRLFDQEWAGQLAAAGLSLENFSKIAIHGQLKYIQGDLPGLMNEIRKYNPSVQFPISEG